MRYRTIDGVEKKVSAVCLGAAGYGSQTPQEEAFAFLDRFAEQGGTFLDSAHIYGAWAPEGVNGGCGNSEVVVGRWVRDRGCRKQMVIGTKGGHPDFATGATGMTRDTVLRHLHESLEHLQTDYIDIYWFHRDDRRIPVAEVLGWLKESLAQGLIRAVGCSHWREDRLAEALDVARDTKLPMVRASQIAWSLAASRTPIRDGRFGEQLAMGEATWEFHTRSGLPLVAYNSQAAGFFAAKYDGADFASPDFPKLGMARSYAGEQNLARRERAVALARSKGCSTNQVALAWLLHQPFTTVAVVGPRTLEQLDDSLQASEVSLTDEDVRHLRADGP